LEGRTGALAGRSTCPTCLGPVGEELAAKNAKALAKGQAQRARAEKLLSEARARVRVADEQLAE
jgi:hypothetical protein